MIKVIVDSSVFISALGIREIYSQNSRQFFQSLTDEQVILPSIVVEEILVNLRKQGKKNLLVIYKYLQSFELIFLNKDFIRQTLPLLQKTSHLKTTDFIIAASASSLKGKLVTWDEKLLLYGKAICEVMTPKDYLQQHKHKKAS